MCIISYYNIIISFSVDGKGFFVIKNPLIKRKVWYYMSEKSEFKKNILMDDYNNFKETNETTKENTIKKGNIILINGASSSGKTTISKELRKALNYSYYIVTLDSCLNMLPSQARPVTEDLILQASVILNNIVKFLCDRGENIIIDHVITSQRIFRAFYELFQTYPVYMVKLTCPINELIKREKIRENRVIGTAENSSAHIVPNKDYDIILDTHLNTINTNIEAIIDLVQNRRCSTIKKLSFLSKVNISNDEICAIIENSLVDFVKVVSHSGNRPFFHNEKIGWVKTFPTAWSNFIFYSCFDDTDIDIQLKHLISKIKMGELPQEWLIGPGSKPDNLYEYLKKNGFTKQYGMSGMAIDLEIMDTSIAIPPNVDIVTVNDKQMLESWAEIVSVALFNGETFESCLFEPLLNNKQIKFYIAYLDNKPVSSSMLLLSNGVASIDMVATLREFQCRGIGTAMVKIPLLYARMQNYKIGVLQASQAGEHGYRKIGFEEYCRLDVYKYCM